MPEKTQERPLVGIHIGKGDTKNGKEEATLPNNRHKGPIMYNSTDFKQLKGLEPVQHRPGMYTDTRSPLHLIAEILDNAIDETAVVAGRRVDLEIDRDIISVRDFGRGIPFDVHPEYGVTGVRMAFELLHAGAKFYNEQGSVYTTTGGLHGVGCSVVNALSANLTVTSFRNGIKHKVCYENGVFLSEETLPTTEENGTKILFTPDNRYFSEKVSTPDILTLIKQRSATSGIRIAVKADGIENIYSVSLREVFRDMIPQRAKDRCIEIPFSGAGGSREKKISVEGVLAVGWTTISGCNSFYNNIPTPNDGDHAFAAEEALLEVMREALGSDLRLDLLLSSDIQRSLLVSVKVPSVYNASLSGQQKSSLRCAEAYTAVYRTVSQAVRSAVMRDSAAKKSILEYIQKRISRRESERVGAERRGSAKLPTPNVYFPPRSWGPNSELFVVEGKSAARPSSIDLKFQGIVGLRGVVVNSFSSEKRNQSLDWIIYEGAARVGRIIVLTDADPAGSEIIVLALAYMYKYGKEIFRQGKVYVGRPPLFKTVFPDKSVHFTDSKMSDIPPGSRVTEFKGLARMNDIDMRTCCTNPASRKIEAVALADEPSTEKTFQLLLSSAVPPRRRWLEDHLAQ